jgi:acyl-CoA hydrolase
MLMPAVRRYFPLPLALSIALLLVSGCSDQGKTFDTLDPGAAVLAFGDSVTYGLGANRGEDYPTLLARDTGWQVINAGISGDTAQRAVNRIGPLLQRHQPSLVIVELGGNDFLRNQPESRVKEHLRAILRTCGEFGVTTALVSVPRLSLLRAGLGSLSDSAIYAELAEEEAVLLIPDVFAEILSDTTLLADRIHPNSSGYEALNAGILKVLQKAGLVQQEGKG